ncbi:aldehyde dehydrogenase family protein [Halorarum halophilum]|uniref:aldehyde dehydrogenase family protein n=1 Tax=Halorarum halophilum TaxID=2743090 RepID=UPI001FE43D42|nr:aldehyde dehydrogenase family protein [Halobaculum halophilum]
MVLTPRVVGSTWSEVLGGPRIIADERESTLDYVQVGESEGATLETGGGVPSEACHETGHYVEPTVFSGVDSDMRIAQEEIFGPVVGVIPVESLRRRST